MSRSRRPLRRKLFGGFAIAAGLVLIAFEFGRPGTSVLQVERWFWGLVGLAVVGLGAMELLWPPSGEGP